MTHITVKGRLTDAPELRFTPSGAAVANFTVAEDIRKYNRQTSEWETVSTTFWRCSVWREAAENVAESLHKGVAVVGTGTIASRDFETKEGEKRTVIEVTLDAIGPDLRWQTATVAKAERKGGGFGQQAPASDPWAAPPATDEPSW